MPQQEPIVLFLGVEILPNFTMQHTTDYLKRYCAIYILGDTLYVKRLGNDKTTYAIDFDYSDKISYVRKIKDEHGNNLDNESVFENNNYGLDANDDDLDYDDLLD